MVQPIWHDKNRTIPERVNALLDEMTLAEQIGQLGSFWVKDVDAVAAQASDKNVAPMENTFGASKLPFAKAAAAGLGQLTRIYGTDPLTPSDGRKRLDEMQEQVQDLSRFGIPALAHEECLLGVTAYQATVYPTGIAWGATWRPELVEEMTHHIGRDMRALNVHQGLSPVMDVVRDYRWGRVEETMGEDPYLVGTIGAAYVRGLEEEGIVATPKHFAGYSGSRAARNHAPVSVGWRELEDVYLPPFEMAIRLGGARSLMNSYSDIDGVPATEADFLLTEVLRDRWGFTGTVVSDYWSIKFLHQMQHVAADDQEAAAKAINAGIDVELPDILCYARLEEAVAAGQVAPEVVRRAAYRVLCQKVGLGLLDVPVAQAPHEEVNLDSAKNRVLARRLADESLVLLKNDGILPLQAQPSRVAVVGPVAVEPRCFLGGYSFPNHVLSRFEDKGTGIALPALPEVLATQFTGEMTVVEGVGFLGGEDEEIARAVAAAQDAELCLLTVGDIAGLFGGGTSGEGCDVPDLRLPGRQHELVEQVLATGTPTILVVVSGRPYALGDFADRAAAIVQAFMPGCEGSAAITALLTGETNPSGKLPVGVPRTTGGQPGTYLGAPLSWHTAGISNIDPRPLYEFGFGLSYTSFELSDCALDTAEIAPDGTVRVSVTVTNTGQRAGAEVVQLYSADIAAQVVRPRKELVGYQKIDLAAGEQARLTFEVHADRLSFTGRTGKRIVEPGVFEFGVGTSSENIAFTKQLKVVGECRTVTGERILLTPVTIERQ